MTASEIIDALIARSDDKIWAAEVHFYDHEVDSRVDFWTLEPTRSQQFRATSYEIKISRDDFRRDSEKKQDAALRWSDRFWYVTPLDILQITEIPVWAGLLVWDGKNFAVKRRAPMRAKAAPSWEVIVSVLRNSGDCRRDVRLLKAQLAFHQYESARQRQIDKRRNDAFMRKIVRRHTPVQLAPPQHPDD